MNERSNPPAMLGRINPPSIIIVDLTEISTLSEKHSGSIRLINNLDKSSGNTLQLSNQATES